MFSRVNILTLKLKVMIKILILKLTMLEYQNTKLFLKKTTFGIDQKKFLLLKKLTVLYRNHMLLVILTLKELFYERELEKSLLNSC